MGGSSSSQQPPQPTSGSKDPTSPRLGPRGGQKGKKVHACVYPECGKIYTRLEHLGRHEKSHSSDNENFCEVCRQKLSRTDTYQKHLLTKKHRSNLQVQDKFPGFKVPSFEPIGTLLNVSPVSPSKHVEESHIHSEHTFMAAKKDQLPRSTAPDNDPPTIHAQPTGDDSKHQEWIEAEEHARKEEHEHAYQVRKKQLSLHNHVANGRLAYVKEFLAAMRDLDLEFRDSQGQTALSLAAYYGHGKIAALLLHSDQQRVDVNSQDIMGRTPLSHAAEKGYIDIVTLLTAQKGVNVNVRDAQDRTPLTWARLGGHNAVAKRLIDAGARESNIDTFTDSGYASMAVDKDELHQPAAADDDSRTVYSLSSLSGMDKNSIDYQLALVSELTKDLRLSLVHGEFLPQTTPVLLSLFRSFAVRLGYEAEQKIEFDAMRFIAKYRSEIVQILQEQWGSQEQTMTRLGDFEMNKEERIRLWLANQGKELAKNLDSQEQEFLSNQMDSGYLDDNKRMDDSPIDIGFVTRTSAYTWLNRKLINLLCLSIPISKTMAAIRKKIENCFPSTANISRQTVRLRHTMIFNLDWPIFQLLDAYYYDGAQSTEDILKTYVTLTSDGVHVQALTASQYLRQNWPESGEQILDLIIRLVKTGEASLVIADTTIAADVVDSQLYFGVTGLVDSICEIGEQLIWMGAVFRSSPIKNAVYESTPSIQNIRQMTSEVSRYNNMNQREYYSCKITYSMAKVSSESLSGRCWHGLFRYAVIAQGFPIARRADSTQGLEISLGMILALCQAQHIGRFDDQIIIKGFSSMCYLTDHQRGISIWHFAGNKDGRYFSCLDTNLGGQHQSLGIHEITEDRHFVGWSLDASYGIGALDSNYRVRSTKLPAPHAGCLLHGKSLRRGQRYPVETICIPDSKDGPRIAKRSLHERLKRIHIRPIVLWDAEGQRGWLTNGTSALLHLVLMSVENDGSLFNSAYSLRKDEIKQRKSKIQLENAARILLDERNWGLLILDDGEQTFNLRHRIDDLYFLLDLAIETQIISMAKNKIVPGILEGWDFMDIAGMAHDPIKSRAYTLEKDCRGWMNFLQDTNAVTLFGNDFGELFKPKDLNSCGFWRTLPQQNCYLAANMGDLVLFAEAYYGNTEIPSRRLSENTMWPIVPKTLQQCICLGSSSGNSEHSDLVQVLLPQSPCTTKSDIQSTTDSMPKNGFVIFGEVKNPSQFQPNYCISPSTNPTTDPTDSLTHSTDSELRDSGLDESIPSLMISKPPSTRILQPADYRVAIVCALEEEFKAIRCLFDEEFDDPVFNESDDNNGYVFGRMESHNIVAACLPGIYGTASAAHLVTKLTCTFQKVEFCLLVGIGGGMPSKKNDIRLGDVVVSCPRGAKPGAIKHDFLQIVGNGRSEFLGRLKDPPDRLLSATIKIRSSPDKQIHTLQPYLDAISKDHPEYCYPGADMDTLYATPCSFTGTEEIVVQRSKRETTQPRVHYGLIVTGDSLVKDAGTRDRLAQDYGALCFEMEAAGVLNVIPSLIIRGICDYSDSHKNDDWHEYASATAAAYAKFLLAKVRA